MLKLSALNIGVEDPSRMWEVKVAINAVCTVEPLADSSAKYRLQLGDRLSETASTETFRMNLSAAEKIFGKLEPGVLVEIDLEKIMQFINDIQQLMKDYKKE